MKLNQNHFVQTEEYSDILFAVNFIIYKSQDSKRFVDMFLTRNFEEIACDFRKLLKEHEINLNHLKESFLLNGLSPEDHVSLLFKQDLVKFVSRNFQEKETQLASSEVNLPNWEDSLNITDRQRKALGLIGDLWSKYSKRNLSLDEDRDTQIKIDGRFFIPGGRFTEMYYWDSYWILIGLLEFNMEDCAFDLIKGFTQLIKRFGYIPNGTRTYYLGRSQPPYFCQMLYRMYLNTNHQEIINYILTEALDQACTEYEWFMTNRRVDPTLIDGGVLNRYFSDSKIPRPESYKEDIKTYMECTEEDKQTLFSNIWAACESGWDFSTRWFSNGRNMSTIDTINIIPVDLNALMLENERIITYLCHERMNLLRVEDKKTQSIIDSLSLNRVRRWESIQRWLFNDDLGCWCDLNIKTNTHTTSRFYFSNLTPLFYSSELLRDRRNLAYKILLKYSNDIFKNPGGVPSSGSLPNDHKQLHKLEQWDFPNTWAPHVQMLTEFLMNIGEDKLAFHVAKSFMSSVMPKDAPVEKFLEKYDCSDADKKAGGGEYEIQEGFGWTNGTVVYLIKMFGARLDDDSSHEASYNEIIHYLRNKVNEADLSIISDIEETLCEIKDLQLAEEIVAEDESIHQQSVHPCASI